MHFTDQKSEICVIRNDGAKKNFGTRIVRKKFTQLQNVCPIKINSSSHEKPNKTQKTRKKMHIDVNYFGS